MNLTVVIPFYNEENFLRKSVERVLKIKDIKTIYLINDGSKDNSLDIAKQLELENTSIKLLSSDINSGKGDALNLVREYIETSHVVIHDADLEYFPDDIQGMFELSQNNPTALILGTRFRGYKDRKNLYMRTLIANKLLSTLFSIVHFKRISDIATCYKLMPTSYFKYQEIKEKGFSIEVELLAKFIKTKESIIEFPISYEGRSYEEGKKIGLKDGFSFIFTIFKYRVTK
jgi:glycosyltransferase involved in cell wall biosynthesis